MQFSVAVVYIVLFARGSRLKPDEASIYVHIYVDIVQRVLNMISPQRLIENAIAVHYMQFNLECNFTPNTCTCKFYTQDDIMHDSYSANSFVVPEPAEMLNSFGKFVRETA